MTKEQIAQQLFGKPYADLSIAQQIKVDDTFEANKPAPGAVPAGAPPETRSINGQQMGWNPATNAFDIPVGAPAQSISIVQQEPVSSQGAYSADEVRQLIAGAGGRVTVDSGFITASYPDGSTAQFDPIRNRDGTIRYNPTPKAAASASAEARPYYTTDSKTGIVSAIDANGDVIADYYRTPTGLKKVPNPTYKGTMAAPATPPAGSATGGGSQAAAPTSTAQQTTQKYDEIGTEGTGRNYKFGTAAGGEGFTTYDPESNTSFGQSGSYVRGPSSITGGPSGPITVTSNDPNQNKVTRYGGASDLALGIGTGISRSGSTSRGTESGAYMPADPNEFVVSAEQLAALANVVPPAPEEQPPGMAEGGSVMTGPSAGRLNFYERMGRESRPMAGNPDAYVQPGPNDSMGIMQRTPYYWEMQELKARNPGLYAYYQRYGRGGDAAGTSPFYSSMGYGMQDDQISPPTNPGLPGRGNNGRGRQGNGPPLGRPPLGGDDTRYGLSSPLSQDAYPGSPWGEYVPFSMAQGGQVVTGNEPMTVVGDQTGDAYARIGEMNALTGQPTQEVLNVTPMEPSMPMPSMPPTAFSQLLETLMPRSKKGRKPALRPAGATMTGAGMGGGYAA